MYWNSHLKGIKCEKIEVTTMQSSFLSIYIDDDCNSIRFPLVDNFNLNLDKINLEKINPTGAETDYLLLQRKNKNERVKL